MINTAPHCPCCLACHGFGEVMSAAQLCSCTKGPVRNRRKRVCMASFAPAGCLACSFVAQHNRASNRLEPLEGLSPILQAAATARVAQPASACCLLPACQCLPVPVGVRLGRAKLGAIVWAFPKSHQLINPSAGCPPLQARSAPPPGPPPRQTASSIICCSCSCSCARPVGGLSSPVCCTTAQPHDRNAARRALVLRVSRVSRYVP